MRRLAVFRVVAYFLREAAVSLGRSWRVSLLAVVTIAASVFIGGTFLLLIENLSRVVAEWRGEARIVVYLDPAQSAAERQALGRGLRSKPWVEQVEEVSAARARERFREIFPSVAELVEGWREEPLPPSLEIAFQPERVADERLASWLAELRRQPGVTMVDDDRDWLQQLETLVGLLKGIGLMVGLALLGAAVFTIASVVRLTAYLYREEIAVMRMVGATELYVRGPFYLEGLLQGLAGGALALLGLWVGFAALSAPGSTSLFGAVLVGRFLSWQQLLALLALGGSAGLLGAVVSLRRER